MTIHKLSFLLSSLLVLQLSYGQEKTPVKYGKISPADFNQTAPAFDSAADAVVIADVGSSEFQGSMKGWFTLEFKHYTRIKILNKNGIAAGTVEIPLWVSGNDIEKLESLKAVTYNLENGKVTETKLDNSAVFTDKLSRNLIVKKFTMPAIKENSIIEYSYVQQSDFLENLQPWTFQGEYPVLWSQYDVSMPNFFDYVTLSQGYLAIDHKSSERNVKFQVTLPSAAGRDEHGEFEDVVVDHHWVMKNIPALKEEPFTTTLNNHVAKIEFQLARYKFPNSMIKDVMPNWVSTSESLLKSEYFGVDLDRNNGWMDDELKTITAGSANKFEASQKIYAYVRDKFLCTGHYGFEINTPLKTVFKNKSGTEAELNLLLIALLKHAGISADPVILSTRKHGFTNEIYPLMTRFNYVVARAIIDSSGYYLDASQPWLGYGRLPDYCYNGHARVINKDLPEPVYMEADSVVEGKLAMVLITNESKSVLSGKLDYKPGFFEACHVRDEVKKDGEKAYFKKLQANFPQETELYNTSIDSLKQMDEPLAVSCEFKLKLDSTDNLVYFNPMISGGLKENPFKAAVRKYPVEMPAAMDETYVLNMEIPDGYVVDEIPKSAKVLFNDDEGFFEYIIQKDDANIQLRTRVKLRKANFKSDDYNTLRDFFAFVVKKQNEQIVFKKKS